MTEQNTTIYCVSVALEHHKQKAIEQIAELDPSAMLGLEGNSAVFWVETSLTIHQVRALEHVYDAVSSTMNKDRSQWYAKPID